MGAPTRLVHHKITNQFNTKHIIKQIKKAYIAGTGSYAPSKILTNDDLSKMVDTNDEWIVTRTGIKERRIARDDEASSDLAVIAARNALEMAETNANDIELILVATSTPDRLFPTTACYVQKKLECPGIPAVDMLAACSGFTYALNTGWQYVATGQYKNVLVIGAETLSKIVNYKDRGTCILLGDSAGAVILKESNTSSEILYGKLGADGRYDDMIIQPAGGSAMPVTKERLEKGLNLLQMKGREVYKFAVNKFVELTQDAVKKCNITVDDIKLLIPHQVNLRIIESAAEKLNIPMEKVYVNIQKYGNTSAGSIPVALDEANRSGRIKRGDIIVMVAFGAGLTWGSVAIRW